MLTRSLVLLVCQFRHFRISHFMEITVPSRRMIVYQIYGTMSIGFLYSFFILFSFFTETVRYLLCLILARDHRKSKAKSACTQRGVHLLLFKGISPGYFHAFMHISPPTVHALLSVSYTSIIHTKCHTGYLLWLIPVPQSC